ncbi:Protein HIRA [Trichinella sp. T8]|nr:Protein HIRA [Trichinella sp. T8]
MRVAGSRRRSSQWRSFGRPVPPLTFRPSFPLQPLSSPAPEQSERHPAILPIEHEVTHGLIRRCHLRQLHAGMFQTLAMLRQRYWIPQRRSRVRHVIRGCLQCRWATSRPLQPSMAALLEDQTNPAPAPARVGMDFTIPLFVGVTKKATAPRYACLITCMVSRAIHLELVVEMSTVGVLQTLRRFMPRRGRPATIQTDNFRSFQSAASELRRLWREIDVDQVQRYLAGQRIQWKFIPQRAPWMGGYWARFVRTTKESLRNVLGQALLDDEGLRTLLCEVEACLNAWPLTLLLTGRTYADLPEVEDQDPIWHPPERGRREWNSRWRYRQQLLAKWWRRWRSGYLATLLPRWKWTSTTEGPKLNDLILILEDNVPRARCPLGVVTELFPGNDGVFRAARLRTSTAEVTRLVAKLVVLEPARISDGRTISIGGYGDETYLTFPPFQCCQYSRYSPLRSRANMYHSFTSKKLLVVGAGGIGCELLKTLVLSGFADIEVIDMDTIEVTNLNRQFLFRKEHVGLSKAKVAVESVSVLNPNVKLVYYCKPIQSREFNVNYFKKFTAVLNCLDNIEARSYVNRMCLICHLPLIDGGSLGRKGQVDVIIRNITECFDCHKHSPSHDYPSCTIRNTPTEPAHCVIWAQHLFNQLFGEVNSDQDVSPESLVTGEEFEATPQVQPLTNIISLQDLAKNHNYDPEVIIKKLFVNDIEYLRTMEKLWEGRQPPTPLNLRWFRIGLDESLQGTEQKDWESRDQNVWTLKECFKVAVSCLSVLKERAKNAPLIWQKDDPVCVDFVTAFTNFRCHVFNIEKIPRFEAETIAGRVVPAIVSTNAMVAGLMVLKLYAVLERRKDFYGSVAISSQEGMPRVLSIAPSTEVTGCEYCVAVKEVEVSLNVSTFTVENLGKIAKELSVMKPEIMLEVASPRLLFAHDYKLSAEEGKKTLSEISVKHGSLLRCEDGATFTNIRIIISDCPEIYDSEAKYVVHVIFDSIELIGNEVHKAELGLPIYSVDIEPAGNRFATGGQSVTGIGLIVLWSLKPVIDVENETNDKIPLLLCRLEAHSTCINCIRWSSDSRYLASAGTDQAVKIWRFVSYIPNVQSRVTAVEHWKCVSTLHGHAGDVLHLSWSPGDRYLASCGIDNIIIIWNAKKFPEKITSLVGHEGFVKGVCWDPIGKYLASQSDDRSLRIWSTMDWNVVHKFRRPFKEAPCATHTLRLDWSPDGLLLATAHAVNNGGPVSKIIERNGWKCELDFAGHRMAITCVRWSNVLYHRNRKVLLTEKSNVCSCCAIGSKDRSLSVWSASENRPVVVLTDIFESSISDISWDSSGLILIAASVDGSVVCLVWTTDELGVPLSLDEKINNLRRYYGNVDVGLLGLQRKSDQNSNKIIEDADYVMTHAKVIANRSNENGVNGGVCASTTAVRTAPPPSTSDSNWNVQLETRTKSGKRRITPINVEVVAEVDTDNNSQPPWIREGVGLGVAGKAKGLIDEKMTVIDNAERWSGLNSTTVEPLVASSFSSASAFKSTLVKSRKGDNFDAGGKSISKSSEDHSGGIVEEFLEKSKSELKFDKKKSWHQKGKKASKHAQRESAISQTFPSSETEVEVETDFQTHQTVAVSSSSKQKTPTHRLEALKVVQLLMSSVVVDESESEVLLQLSNNIGSKPKGKFAELLCMKNSNCVWKVLLETGAVALKANRHLILVVFENGMFDILSPLDGRMMCLTNVLGDSVHYVNLDGKLIALVTVCAELYVWSFVKSLELVCQVSLKALLRDPKRNLSRIVFSAVGMPIISFNDGSLFSYDASSKIWQKLLNPSDSFIKYSPTSMLASTKAYLKTKGRFQNLCKNLFSSVTFTAESDSEMQERIREGFLERFSLASRAVGSEHEYMYWLSEYVKLLVKAESEVKLRCLFRTLVESDEHMKTNSMLSRDKSEKRSAVTDLLPLVAANPKLQRLYSELSFLVAEKSSNEQADDLYSEIAATTTNSLKLSCDVMSVEKFMKSAPEEKSSHMSMAVILLNKMNKRCVGYVLKSDKDSSSGSRFILTTRTCSANFNRQINAPIYILPENKERHVKAIHTRGFHESLAVIEMQDKYAFQLASESTCPLEFPEISEECFTVYAVESQVNKRDIVAEPYKSSPKSSCEKYWITFNEKSFACAATSQKEKRNGLGLVCSQGGKLALVGISSENQQTTSVTSFTLLYPYAKQTGKCFHRINKIFQFLENVMQRFATKNEIARFTFLKFNTNYWAKAVF